MTKRERLDLTDRDLIVLEVVQKFRAIQSRHLAILCGFTSQSYVEKRLRKLTKFRYLKRARQLAGFPYVYSLGVQGKYELGFLGKVPNVSEATIRHELGVAEIACYLKLTKNIEFEQMMTDRDYRLYDTKRQTADEYSLVDVASGLDHLPDLVYIDQGRLTVVEFERTLKTRDRLQANILQNGNKDSVSNQLWVVPKRRVSIWNRINAIAQDFERIEPTLAILAFEEIEQTVQAVDLSQNKPIERTWRDTKTIVDAFKGLSDEFSDVSNCFWCKETSEVQNFLDGAIERFKPAGTISTTNAPVKEQTNLQKQVESTVSKPKEAVPPPISDIQEPKEKPKRIVLGEKNRKKATKNPFDRFF